MAANNLLRDYQPCTVVVLDLDKYVTSDILVAYFSNFGRVVHVYVKQKLTTAFAFVKFSNRAAAARALSMNPHMIQRRHVRVLRAFKNTHTAVPDVPFPGMCWTSSTPATVLDDNMVLQALRSLWA